MKRKTVRKRKRGKNKKGAGRPRKLLALSPKKKKKVSRGKPLGVSQVTDAKDLTLFMAFCLNLFGCSAAWGS